MTDFEIPPKTANIDVFDFSHDVYGNPTAHCLVTWSNDKTGDDWRGSSIITKRRQQTGYCDKFSGGALDALEKRFPGTRWIVEADSVTGDRSSGRVTFTASRNFDKEPIPVIFRVEKSGDFKGEVTAVFPTLPGTNDPNTCSCYAHNGQHGSASKDWYDTTRPATQEEYESLKLELKSAPFNYILQVRKKWVKSFDKQRRIALS